jgi:predicted neutral ceramidase superfamily lipid hydrolase
MKISNRVLGIIAMAASPFLFVELFATQKGNTSNSGIYDLLYMAGWVCTIIGLLRLQATGEERNSKFVLYLQLVLLGIANIWNGWTIVDPGNKSMLYFILDFSWPLSNVCLLVVGIVVAKKAVLTGWKRYTVLIAGLWLLFTFLTMLVFGNTTTAVIISGGYSAIAWFFMGYMISITPKQAGESFVISRAA